VNTVVFNPALGAGGNIAANSNPFVGMTPSWRFAITAYVLFWKVLPPLFSEALHGSDRAYPVVHTLLVIGVDLLLLLPLMVRQLGSIPTGWLHPLIFSTLAAWAVGIMKAPQSLLYPFLVWFEPIHRGIEHPLLGGWSAAQVSLAQLELEALTLLSLVSLYAGFLMFNLRAPVVRFSPPRYMGFKVFVVVGILMLLFIWLIQTSGGLIDHISSFGLGRQRALEGQGHLVGLIRFMPVVLIIWYAFDRNLLRHPWYMALLLGSLAIQFMTAGSRSSVLNPLMFFFAVWIYHHRRIPAARIVLLGLVGLILIGVLGEIRTSSMGGKQQADFSALLNFDPVAALEAAQEEIGARGENSASLPTIAFAGERVPLLWGRTYVAALGFFIPSAIWKDKPRGAGAHAGAMIFGSHTLEEAKNYTGGGVPPGAVAEAYWNFHVPGVIFIFVFFGAFKRWLANIFIRYRDEPAAVAFYLFSTFSLGSPATIVITAYFRNTILILAFYYFIGSLRLRQRRFRSARYEG
jgi:hypothetical protein